MTENGALYPHPIVEAHAGRLDPADVDRRMRDDEERDRLLGYTGRSREKIGELRAAADAAHDAYVSDNRKLYRDDGRKRYSETEHAELENGIKRRRDEAFAELGRLADELSSDAAQKLRTASATGRRLSDGELGRANGRKEFVREDVERLPLGEVPGLLRDTEASGDMVDKWLAARYAGIRADRELEALRENGGADVGAEEISRHLREIREGAGRLQQQLLPPGHKELISGLESLRGDAANLKTYVKSKSITEEERVAISSTPFG